MINLSSKLSCWRLPLFFPRTVPAPALATVSALEMIFFREYNVPFFGHVIIFGVKLIGESQSLFFIRMQIYFCFSIHFSTINNVKISLSTLPLQSSFYFHLAPFNIFLPSPATKFFMKNYQKINNLIGWLVFAVAAFTYCSTIEPTGSVWDCGECIATANKREVGHPPGAPLFMFLARVFILFGGSNTAMFPIMVNILSALMSAFCILFLFWTITALARKTIIGKGEVSMDKIIAVMGAGVDRPCARDR